MIYLEQFRFITFEKEDRFLADYYQSHPWDNGSPYPFGVLSKCGLHSLNFSEITILYGGNGSGKSTALNLIGCNPSGFSCNKTEGTVGNSVTSECLTGKSAAVNTSELNSLRH